MRSFFSRKQMGHRNRRGFAIAEVLVAAVILAFALAAFFQAFRIGDWLNISARINSRLGRLTRRFSDQMEYAPYDTLGTTTLESGFLYQPVDVTGHKAPPDINFAYDKAANPNGGTGVTYLSLFPYHVESVVTKFNVGASNEYATISLKIFYTGQPSLKDDTDPGERLWYDNGATLIRTRF